MEKMGSSIKSYFLMSALSLVLFSFCTKQVAGPKGEKGTDGAQGNMVMSSTKSFVLDSMSWTKQEFDWVAYLYVAEIDKVALEKGEVKVYALIGSDWVDLPYVEGLFVTRFNLQLGIVKLNYYNTHTAIPGRPASRNYRVVVMAPVQ